MTNNRRFRFWQMRSKEATRAWFLNLLRSPAPQALARMTGNFVPNLVIASAMNLFLQLLRCPLPVWIPGFRHWQAKWQHFAQNLYYGLLIEALIVGLSFTGAEFVLNTQSNMLDWSMNVMSNLRFQPERHRNQLFLDVDEATYRDPVWGGGEPRAVPLEPIARLIEFSLEQGTRYVVVDFLIDGTPDADQERFRARVERLLKEKRYVDSHLIFVRSASAPLTSGLASRLRPSILDDLISRFPDQVHAAVPQFVVSGHDHVLREWQLWQSVCIPDPAGLAGEGSWAVLPSVQVLIKALEEKKALPPLRPGNASVARDVCALDGAVAAVLAKASDNRRADFLAGRWVLDTLGRCYVQGGFDSGMCAREARIPAAGPQITVDPGGAARQAVGNRVIFTIPDRLQDNAAMATTPLPYFVRQSARDVLSGMPAFRFSDAKPPLVTIVGASYADSRDFHFTPLGRMPGSLVLVNAIDSMILHGVVQAPGMIVKIVVVVGCLLAISYLFAIFPSNLATAGATLAVLFALLPLSLILLQSHGIHLDLAAPLIGVYLHRELEEQKERNRHAGSSSH